ncbi:MAG: hypothetical protein B6226_00185 [Candidatus Cloacimonetes bacterium 4572_65]|nr:MAG: hypothetical protein B6226_00185 [Candidatus Cloacimonetes bacterium 4572_65]
MKYYMKLGFILLFTCAIAAGILSYLNGVTAPLIAEVKRVEEEKGRFDVMVDENLKAEDISFHPQFLDIDIKGDTLFYYIAKDKEGNKIGYALKATKSGYSGNIVTVVGLRADYTIKKIKVIGQTETPGLGAKCVAPNFAPRFVNLTKDQLKVDKDGGTIKSITGATITTRTITQSIQVSINKLLEKEGK